MRSLCLWGGLRGFTGQFPRQKWMQQQFPPRSPWLIAAMRHLPIAVTKTGSPRASRDTSWWSKNQAVPFGKRLHNYGKSPFFMGKITISTGPCSIAMLNYQRVTIYEHPLGHLGEGWIVLHPRDSNPRKFCLTRPLKVNVPCIRKGVAWTTERLHRRIHSWFAHPFLCMNDPWFSIILSLLFNNLLQLKAMSLQLYSWG